MANHVADETRDRTVRDRTGRGGIEPRNPSGVQWSCFRILIPVPSSRVVVRVCGTRRKPGASRRIEVVTTGILIAMRRLRERGESEVSSMASSYSYDAMSRRLIPTSITGQRVIGIIDVDGSASNGKRSCTDSP